MMMMMMMIMEMEMVDDGAREVYSIGLDIYLFREKYMEVIVFYIFTVTVTYLV